MVPVDSSMARMPLPGATIAWAVSTSCSKISVMYRSPCTKNEVFEIQRSIVAFNTGKFIGRRLRLSGRPHQAQTPDRQHFGVLCNRRLRPGPCGQSGLTPNGRLQDKRAGRRHAAPKAARPLYATERILSVLVPPITP